MLQPIIFLLISLFLLVVSGIYVARRLVRPMHFSFVIRRLLLSIMAIAFAFAYSAPGFMFLARKQLVSFSFANSVQSWSYPFLGYLSILMTVLIIEDVFILLRKSVLFAFWHMHSRRVIARFSGYFHFLRRSHRAERLGRLSVFIISIAIYSTAIKNGKEPLLTEVQTPVFNLARGFEGYRIALITDVHVGPVYGRELVEKIVAKTNDAKVDLIVIAGDAADGMPENLEPEVAPFANLHATDGVVYVTGNHEYYWDAIAWMKTFEKLGARVLMNSEKIIRRGDSILAVGGVPDRQGQRFIPSHIIDITKTFSQTPHNANTTWILAAHQPKVVEDAIAAGVDLQLSGHTHGGQFFPWTWVVRLLQTYPRGLFELGNTTLFVSQGAGAWGPPLRLGASAEIPILTLEPKKL